MQSTHWLIHVLRKRKRNGLAQAVQNLITELMLVGFIALLLTVLQGPISKICGEMGRTFFCTARSWLAVPARQQRFVALGCGPGRGALACTPAHKVAAACCLQWHTSPDRTIFGR